MHKEFRTEGIILKRNNTSYNDKIITIFSKDFGKIDLMIRGVRKFTSRRSPLIDLFNKVKIIISVTSKYENIEEIEVITSYQNLKKDFQKITSVYLISELIDKLSAPKEKNQILYENLNKYLELLENNKFNQVDLLTDKFITYIYKTSGFAEISDTLSNQNIISKIEEILEKKLRSLSLTKTYSI